MSESNISQIEDQLKNDPSNVKEEDLYIYLYAKSKNENINYPTVQLDQIKIFLNKISKSFAYQNIFINTGNYSSIIISIIGLLIPFYYFFPRFYKMGIIALIIGLASFMGLIGKTNDMYSIFFPHINIILIAVSFVIYFIFFIIINKLNHISLFFICVVISFLIVNYILKLILLTPSKKNKYLDLQIDKNDKVVEKDYTEYNLNIEAACLQVIKRNKLKLPNGYMLYSYLTVFSFVDTTNMKKLSLDFSLNLIAPFLSVIILWFFGKFLSSLKYKNNDEEGLEVKDRNNSMNIFSIIGISDETDKYLFCQANYVLPEEFNSNILISDYLKDIDIKNNELYLKAHKALYRITNEYLDEYNPLFKFKSKTNSFSDNKIDSNKIICKIKNVVNESKLEGDHVEKNRKKILDKIDTIIEKSNNKYSNIKQKIQDEIKDDESSFFHLPYVDRLKILDFLCHVENELSIENNLNDDYFKNFNEYIHLAKEAIDIDEKLEPKEKEFIKKKIINYQYKLKNNLENKPPIEHDLENILKSNLENIFEENNENNSNNSKNSLRNNLENNLENIFQDGVENCNDNLKNNNFHPENNVINHNENIPEIKSHIPKISELYGYYYNILGYKFDTSWAYQSKHTILNSHSIFKFLLRLISVWILFTKPIGSGWFLANCMLSSPTNKTFNEATDFRKMMSSDSFIWKYFLTGLDRSKYMYSPLKKEIENKNETFLDIAKKVLKKTGFLILISLVTIPLLLYYNSNVFGFQASPSWVVFVTQLFVGICIAVNLYVITAKKNKGEKLNSFMTYRNFNILYVIFGIILISLIIALV